MITAYWNTVIRAMRAKGVTFEEGLSQSELRALEKRYGIQFPPDLAAFLRCGLPISRGFPRWRTRDVSLSISLAFPADGICFEVEHNDFWLEAWEPRPAQLDKAVAVAHQSLEVAPALVPIYSNRFMPSDPAWSGNPVISVYQTNIVVEAPNLGQYLAAEFGAPALKRPVAKRHPVSFWDDLAS